MARGALPNNHDSSAASVAPDIHPPSPLSGSTTLPKHTPSPSEYGYSTSDVDLLHTLNIERERRYKAESELAITKAELASTREKLETAEKMLEEFRAKHWTSHMYEAAEQMGPGGALIATVGAPVMAAPLAVATVVKGFQSVGTGIGSLFSGTGKGKGKGKGGDTLGSAGDEAGTAPAN